MTISRRHVLLGATAAAALAPIGGSRADIRSRDRRDLSAVRRQRADRRRCAEVVRDRRRGHQQELRFRSAAARKARASPGLGGAKIRLVFADHQADPQKGRAEAERLITQEKVCAIIGTYQSAVAVTVSQVCERYQIPFISADNSSPSLHRRGLKFYFRAAPHDEMFSARDVRLLRRHEEEGHQDRDAVAVPRGHHLRHRFRQRPAQARGRARLQDASPTSSTAPTRRRCRRRCSSSRRRMPTC